MTTSRSEDAAPIAAILGRLNHVGIAVPSIEAALGRYRALFGRGAAGEPFDLPAQGVRVAFVDAPNAQIELIEPLGADSPISAFLARNPAGGQHHLCYEVAEIGAAIAAVEGLGARILGAPRTGAHGTPVVFVHPRDMGGVLVELMECPPTASARRSGSIFGKPDASIQSVGGTLARPEGRPAP